MCVDRFINKYINKMAEKSAEDIERGESLLDLHLGRIVLKRLKSMGEGVNQIELSTGTTETHSSVLLRSIRVAQEMKKHRLGVGALVVICAKSHNDVIIPIIASLYLGCSVFPLSTTMTKIEIKNMLSLGRPSIVFCDEEMSEMFREVLAELYYGSTIVVFAEKPKSGNFGFFGDFLKPTGTEDAFEVTDFDPKETIIFISCSSGTTGFPKGVCQTHRTLGLGLLLTQSTYRDWKTCTGKYLSFASVYWISGVYSIMRSCMTGCTRISCAVPFSVELLDKALKNYKPESVGLTPVAICELVKHPKFAELDYSSIRTLFVLAGPISSTVVSQVQKQIPNVNIVNSYGMTELGSISINFQGVPRSCGKVQPWIQWRIVDPDTGQVLGPNLNGELRLKSVTIFHSYYKNPAATAEAYDSDGWFKTGDLVYFDENNFLFIVDRLKEVLKFRSHQICPAELEFEIMKVPNVVQVAVVGKKHSADGDHPIAIVQKIAGSNLAAKEIKDAMKISEERCLAASPGGELESGGWGQTWLKIETTGGQGSIWAVAPSERDSLSDLKQLRGGVVFLKSLPLTPSGKIDRKKLKKLALDVTGET